MPPTLERVDSVELGAGRLPRQAVPASWWQAAEPLAAFALCGASVAPGFEFADFSFARNDPAARAALQRLRPDALDLL